jgi:hypothetical protein
MKRRILILALALVMAVMLAGCGGGDSGGNGGNGGDNSNNSTNSNSGNDDISGDETAGSPISGGYQLEAPTSGLRMTLPAREWQPAGASGKDAGAQNHVGTNVSVYLPKAGALPSAAELESSLFIKLDGVTRETVTTAVGPAVVLRGTWARDFGTTTMVHIFQEVGSQYVDIMVSGSYDADDVETVVAAILDTISRF